MRVWYINDPSNIADSYEIAWNRRLDADPTAAKVLTEINRKIAERTRRGVVSEGPEEIAGRTEDRISGIVGPPPEVRPTRQRKFLKTIEIFK